MELNPIDPAGIKAPPLIQVNVHDAEHILGLFGILDRVSRPENLALVPGIERQLTLAAILLDKGHRNHLGASLSDDVADDLVIGGLSGVFHGVEAVGALPPNP